MDDPSLADLERDNIRLRQKVRELEEAELTARKARQAVEAEYDGIQEQNSELRAELIHLKQMYDGAVEELRVLRHDLDSRPSPHPEPDPVPIPAPPAATEDMLRPFLASMKTDIADHLAEFQSALHSSVLMNESRIGAGSSMVNEDTGDVLPSAPPAPKKKKGKKKAVRVNAGPERIIWETRNARLTDEITTLKKALTATKHSLLVEKKDNSELRSRYNNAQIELSSIKRATTATDDETSKLKAAVRKSKKDMARKQKEVDARQEELQRLLKEREAMVAESAKAKKALQKSLDKATAAQREKEDELMFEQQQAQQLCQAVDQANEKVIEYEKELEVQRAHIDELANQLETASISVIPESVMTITEAERDLLAGMELDDEDLESLGVMIGR